MAGETKRKLVVVAELQGKLAKQFGEAGNKAKKFGKTTETALGRVRKKVNGLLSSKLGIAAIGAAFALAAVKAVRFGVGMSRSMSAAASRAEETGSKFRAVFGDIADQEQTFVEELGKRVGRSKLELTEAMASFQDTFRPLGFANDEAAALSRTITELGIDLASFNNSTDVEAFEALQSAIVGNHETVRRYGLILTESTLKAEAYSSGIAEVGAKLTEVQKVQARLALITRGSEAAIGDAERTSDQFANTMKKLKGELLDAQSVIGRDLNAKILEMIEAYGGVDVVVDDATKAMEGMATVAIKLGEGLSFLAKGASAWDDIGDAAARAGERWRDAVSDQGVSTTKFDASSHPMMKGFEERKRADMAEEFGAWRPVHDTIMRERAEKAGEAYFKRLREVASEEMKKGDPFIPISMLGPFAIKKSLDAVALGGILTTEALEDVGGEDKVEKATAAVEKLKGATASYAWILANKTIPAMAQFGIAVVQKQKASEALALKVQAGQSVISNFSSAVVNAAQGSKDAFKNMAQSIAADLLMLAAKFQATKLLTAAFPGLGALLSPVAKGGVFNASGITAFAKGGVVNSPTLFRHGSGLGVMGEAGDEGVFPLKRGRGGRLGVENVGGSGGNVTVNLTVMAIDSRTGTEFLLSNARAIGDALKAALFEDYELRTMLAGSHV